MMDYWLLDRTKKPILPPTPDALAKINADKDLAKQQRIDAILSGKPLPSKPNTAALAKIGNAAD